MFHFLQCHQSFAPRAHTCGMENGSGGLPPHLCNPAIDLSVKERYTFQPPISKLRRSGMFIVNSLKKQLSSVGATCKRVRQFQRLLSLTRFGLFSCQFSRGGRAHQSGFGNKIKRLGFTVRGAKQRHLKFNQNITSCFPLPKGEGSRVRGNAAPNFCTVLVPDKALE